MNCCMTNLLQLKEGKKRGEANRGAGSCVRGRKGEGKEGKGNVTLLDELVSA